jgi:hypothetical protein
MYMQRNYKLTATCIQCGYKISKEVISTLANLTTAKNELAKQAGAIHKQHPEITNFDVTDKLLY